MRSSSDRILIVKLGAIGDVLRTTSVLCGLKEKYPSVEIDWLTHSSAKEVLIGNPFIHDIITWEQRGQLGGYDYDIVIGLEDDYAACELVSRLRTGKIIGSYLENGKQVYTPSSWFDISLISKYGIEKANRLKQENRRTFQQHMQELLEVKTGEYVFSLTAEELNYGVDYSKSLGISKDKIILGINTGAGKRWPQKSLSIERTIDLVSQLKNELGVVCLILGGEEEKERNAAICQAAGAPSGGLHSLKGFASVVNCCDTIISSDSLAMHYAIALKKKVVAFFGPTSAYEIELYGRGKTVSPKMDCLACYIKEECGKPETCMDLLRVEDLVKAVRDVVSL